MVSYHQAYLENLVKPGSTRLSILVDNCQIPAKSGSTRVYQAHQPFNQTFVARVYKNVTSKRQHLFSSESKLRHIQALVIGKILFPRINFVPLRCMCSNLSMFLAVYGDHTTNPYSTCDLTNVQNSTFRVSVSFQPLQVLLSRPKILLALFVMAST